MGIAKALNHYGIKSIWHFTDRSNLESIKKYGLLSLENIERRGIDVPCFGANELSHRLDRRKGIDKYVHLSFITEHPMHYAKKRDGLIPNPIWLEIDAVVLLENETIFSNNIANQNGVKFHHINTLATHVDMEALWGKSNENDANMQRRKKSAIRGEIMVKNQINIKNIIRVKNG